MRLGKISSVGSNRSEEHAANYETSHIIIILNNNNIL